MLIRCICPSCDTNFKVDAKYAGKKARCPKCAAVVTVAKQAKSLDKPIDVFPTDDVEPFPAIDVSTAPMSKPKTASTGERLLAAKPLSPAENALPAVDSNTKTVELPAGFPLIDTDAKPPSPDNKETPQHEKSATSVRRSRRASNRQAVWMIGGGGAAVLAVIVIVVIVIANQGNDDPKPIAAPQLQHKTTTLVLHWPLDERKDATIKINGKRKSVPRTGNVQYELPPGSHTILIDRRGFEPFTQTIAVNAGEKYNLTPSWKEAAKTFQFMTGIAGYEDWLQDLDQAMRQATKENKDIMIAFVTSDGDRESAVLRQEVFVNPKFQQICKPKFVRVVIDLPTTERGYNNLTDAAHNDWVRKHYGIDSGDIPSVILTDAKGRPYVNIPGYEDDGRSTYINEFAALSQDREQRDRLLASVAGANAQAKWKAAVEATNWLWEQNIAGFYVDDLTRWLALGQQFDANNARGEHEIVFEAEWTARLHHARIDNHSRLNSIVAELDRWKQNCQFKDGNRGARVHLAAAISLEAEGAVKYIDEALAYKPTDQSLENLLQLAKQYLAEAGEAGTGTGFVVADGGYILTNYHVIEGPGKVEVLLPGTKKKVAARIIQQDAQRDMALLKIDLPDNTTLKPLDIYGERVGLAADIAVFGFPLGDEFGDNLKATRGIINGLPTEESDKMYLLDCRINPGNSGGPLCNNKGQVIGMVTAKTFGGVSIDSLGMAIPADDLMAFIKRNVANYKPGGDVAPKDPLSWEVVAKQVGPSILMVLKSGN